MFADLRGLLIGTTFKRPTLDQFLNYHMLQEPWKVADREDDRAAFARKPWMDNNNRESTGQHVVYFSETPQHFALYI